MNVRSLLLLSCAVVFSGCLGKAKKDDAEAATKQYEQNANLVTVVKLGRTEFQKQLISNGRLEAVRKSALQFKNPGAVATVNVQQGSSVTKGDIIAVLDRTDIANALRQAEQQHERSEIDFYDFLIGLGYKGRDTVGIPTDVLRRASVRSGYLSSCITLETAQQNFDDATLRAPFSGKVANLMQKEYETTGGDFCTIIDDSSLDVDFNVLESELAYVKPGLNVKVATFNQPDKYINGTITSVNPTVDQNGQIKVLARIKNNGHMIDGMHVKVLVENNVSDKLVVPKSAVVIRDNQEVLFRFNNGQAAWTYVNIIDANSHSYIVEANAERGAELGEGDLVIISGNLNLGDGSLVELENL